jgi:hypothetical protein
MKNSRGSTTSLLSSVEQREEGCLRIGQRRTIYLLRHCEAANRITQPVVYEGLDEAQNCVLRRLTMTSYRMPRSFLPLRPGVNYFLFSM